MPILERFAAAANARLTGVEYVFPYGFPADVVAAEVRKYGLVNVTFNLPAGNLAAWNAAPVDWLVRKDTGDQSPGPVSRFFAPFFRKAWKVQGPLAAPGDMPRSARGQFLPR